MKALVSTPYKKPDEWDFMQQVPESEWKKMME